MNERLLALLLRRQFEINTLASVAVEYPALRKHPLLQAAADEDANSQPGPGS